MTAMTIRKIIGLLAILFITASQAQAAGTITVKDINEYLETRHLKYSGPAPYLSYFNGDQKIAAEAYLASPKFRKGKVISLTKDANEAIKQINFSAMICNPWSEQRPGFDLKPELQSVKDEKKKLLQAETIAFAKNMFNAEISEDDIAQLKEGEKLDTPVFSLAYMELTAKCDTNGGRSIDYKIFPK